MLLLCNLYTLYNSYFAIFGFWENFVILYILEFWIFGFLFILSCRGQHARGHNSSLSRITSNTRTNQMIGGLTARAAQTPGRRATSSLRSTARADMATFERQIERNRSNELIEFNRHMTYTCKGPTRARDLHV